MYRIFIYLVLFSVSFNLCFTQGLDFKTRITLSEDGDLTNPLTRFDKLHVGVHPDATNGIDTELGEYEIVNHPPSGLHAYMFIPVSDTEIVISYTDIRPNGDENKFYVEYMFDVQWGTTDELFLYWAQLPTDKIDSAYLTDPVTGEFFKINMMDQMTVSTTNRGLERFKVKIWYSKGPVSVKEIELKRDFTTFPNPAENILNHSAGSVFDKVELLNLLGVNVRTISNPGDSLDLSGLPSGVYFARFTDKNGKRVVKKVIKK